jgi:toxin-antitoxin system PIN domain toxin
VKTGAHKRRVLLDVNLLIALFDPNHPFHEKAHTWFAKARRRGWATCPTTVNGAVRIMSNPSYPSFRVTVASIVSHLQELCDSEDHEFWPDSVSLLDRDLFKPELIAGPGQLTDTLLVGTAVRRGGALATFDTRIHFRAVVGATTDCLEVIRNE